jgi:hypothetical protein
MFRFVLWKYLGSEEVDQNSEVRLVALQPRDLVLLCTFGSYLHDVISNERVLQCVRQHADVQQCAEALCHLALAPETREAVRLTKAEIAATVGVPAMKLGSGYDVSCIVIGAAEDE